VLETPRRNAVQGNLDGFYFGLSHAELAQAFAVPLGTMKSTIRRGLVRLKECLDSDDVNA
jgi:DNA-directed RNA polymerase specialized sigma24 family protein